MTYSVYDIKVDNSISFTPGPTAGNVLAISGDGSTYWTEAAAPVDNKTFQTLTDGATIGWTYSNGYNAKVTLGGNRALSITGATNGDYGTLFVIQDGTGSRRINFGVNDKFASGTYSFSTTSSSMDVFSFIYDGSNFYWNAVKNYFIPSDPDVLAFLTAAGISSDTISIAINSFVVGMKANSLWDKMSAIYPFVGGTAFSHKFNLKDPRDLDAAFRLTFGGTVSHTSNGVTGDGTTGYANSYLVPSTTLTNNNTHISLYNRTNNAGDDQDMGVTSATESFQLFLKWSDGNLYSDAYRSATGRVTYAIPNPQGFIVQSRVSSTDHRVFRNGTQVGSTNAGVGGNISTLVNPMYILASDQNNTAVSNSNRNIAFASIGSGLSAAEASTFNTLVAAMQTTLGRNV